MVHREIKESGLDEIFNMRSVVNADHPLAKYLGRNVQFKEQTEENAKKYGTRIFGNTFRCEQIQKDFKGDDCLRLYYNDPKMDNGFGFAFGATELLEIID